MTTQTAPNVKSITIIGRRWFDRVNGNTYFSAEGLVNGKVAVSIDYEYGYGNQYEWSILSLLDKAGLLPGLEHYPSGTSESGWRYCERNGIAYHATHSDVKRKKDL